MPTLSSEDVLAIFVADIHLSDKAPVARSAESNWYAATARPVEQLVAVQNRYHCPVICAGDIFDTWRSSPELINFAIRRLPRMYAVPGQHDLPLHNYEHKHRSAYDTLWHADRIVNLDPGVMTTVDRLRLHPFPWGYPVKPLEASKRDGVIDIAVVHAYVWQERYGYPGAPLHARVQSMRKVLNGYDVAVFGDNHKGFSAQVGNCLVYNCGGFMRRRSDEVEAQPAVGLLRRNGSVQRHKLDCTDDRFIPQALKKLEVHPDFSFSSFMKDLEKLQSEGLELRDAVDAYFRKYAVSKEAKQIILEALTTPPA